MHRLILWSCAIWCIILLFISFLGIYTPNNMCYRIRCVQKSSYRQLLYSNVLWHDVSASTPGSFYWHRYGGDWSL